MSATKGGKTRSTWSEELRTEYLALLRRTGNAGASARMLGHPTLFHGRRARDPVFRLQCRNAVAEADARLGKAASAFPGADPFLPAGDSWEGPPPPMEFKSMPSDDGPPAARDQVIRRTSNGRNQISYVREGEITSAEEAEFLALFRATGNFDAAAMAVGRWPSTFYKRLHKWPDFAMRCEQARNESDIELEYKLVGHAHSLIRRPDEARLEGEEEAPFDADAAMRILHFLDRRRAGRLGGRPRKGPPERTFEQAVESILAKVEAIERHRKLMEERKESERNGDAP